MDATSMVRILLVARKSAEPAAPRSSQRNRSVVDDAGPASTMQTLVGVPDARSNTSKHMNTATVANPVCHKRPSSANSKYRSLKKGKLTSPANEPRLETA